MNINSVGVNAYKQLDTENQAVRKQNPQQAQNAPAAKTSVEIAGNVKKTGSALGVKVNKGAFDEILSTQEKEALEMVFARFRSAAAATATYEKDGNTEKTSLGNMVDVTL